MPTDWRLGASAGATFVRIATAAGLDPAASEQAVARARFHAPLAPSTARAPWQAVILRFAARRNVLGITLGTDVFLRGPAQLDQWPLVAHELAHVVQVLTRGQARFFAGYALEYTRLRMRGMADLPAYFALSDEVEARRVEDAAARAPVPGSLWHG